MDKKELIKKLREYKKLLSAHFDLYKVVLFGSYAHGNPRTDSDIDVAVIVNKVKGDYFTYTPLLWKLRRNVDDRIEPLLFEKEKDSNGFLQQIMAEGIEV